MGHSIKNQLEQSVSAACHAGGSKRSERSHPDNAGRIYSCGGKEPDKTYAGELKRLAGDLGSWLKENYPECRMAYQISPSMLQGYINYKADSGVAASTLRTTVSKIRHLEKSVALHFRNANIDWKSDKVHVPAGVTDSYEKVRDKVMGEETYKKVLGAMSTRTETYKSLVLSHVAGLRVRETSLVHRECVQFEGGRYGYGTITLRPGAIDGAKHGRPRVIDILSAEDRDNLREICRDVRPGQTIIRKSDGTGYKEDSIQRAITRACKKIGIAEEWHQNKNHAIRKDFAQRSYDLVRRETKEQGYTDEKSRMMAENYVEAQLGHGVDRSDREELLNTYIAFRW